MRIKSDLRHELKYLIRRQQMQSLVDELSNYMQLDPHAGELGTYPIASLYYDSPSYKAYWDKVEGHRTRRKVRVRVYGSDRVVPDTPAFVEVKERINVRIRKRRAARSYEDAVDFDDFDTPKDSHGPSELALMHEVYYLYRTLQLRPTCVVHYDRMAWEGRDHYADLRVTFDTNVRGRVHDLTLLSSGQVANHRVLSSDYVILEVKANQNVPLWMAGLLSRHRCTHYRVSKYCAVLEHCNAINARYRVIHARPPKA